MGDPQPQYRTGETAWLDLRTSNAPEALDFYTSLFGWEAVREPLGADHYDTCLLDGQPVAGIASSVPSAEAIGWTTYFAVKDIASSMRAARALGATVSASPRRYRDAGVAAVVEDPQRAIFGLYEAGPRPGIAVINAPGSLCWNELNSADPRESEHFYTSLFDYDVRSVDSATGAEYSMLLLEGSAVAGILGLESEWPTILPARWLTYFAVADLARETARVVELGGTRSLGPLRTEYGEFCVVRDRGRAVFCLARVDNPPRSPVPRDDLPAATDGQS